MKFNYDPQYYRYTFLQLFSVWRRLSHFEHTCIHADGENIAHMMNKEETKMNKHTHHSHRVTVADIEFHCLFLYCLFPKFGRKEKKEMHGYRGGGGVITQ